MIAFITTQFDLRLAFGYSIASSGSASVTDFSDLRKESLDKDALREKLEETRFSEQEKKDEEKDRLLPTVAATVNNVTTQITPAVVPGPEAPLTDTGFLGSGPLWTERNPEGPDAINVREILKDYKMGPEGETIPFQKPDGKPGLIEIKREKDRVTLLEWPNGKIDGTEQVRYQTFDQKDPNSPLGDRLETGFYQSGTGRKQAREVFDLGQKTVTTFGQDGQKEGVFMVRPGFPELPLGRMINGRWVSFDYDRDFSQVKVESKGLATEIYSLGGARGPQLRAVKENDGSSRFFEYAASGERVKERILTTGNEEFVKTYDPNGLLASVQFPGGKVEYTYNGLGLPIEIRDTDGTGAVTTTKFNESGDKVSQSGPRGTWIYDPAGLLAEFIYPKGMPVSREKYHYDDRGRLSHKVITRENGSEMIEKITAAGTTRIMPDGTTYQFGADGTLLKIVNSGGGSEIFERDERGRVLSRTLKNAAGRTLKTALYDDRGLYEVRHVSEGLTYRIQDGLPTVITGRDQTRHYLSYDSSRQLRTIRTLDPSGLDSVRLVRSIGGVPKVVTHISGNGRVTKFNAQGRPVYVRTATRGGSMLQEFGYNRRGRLEKIRLVETDGKRSRTTLLRLDSRGLVRWMLHPGGSEQFFNADGTLRKNVLQDGRVEEFSEYRDGIAGLKVTRAADGKQTTERFDAAGLLVEEIALEDGREYRIFRDEAGRINQKLDLATMERTIYDESGRAVQILNPQGEPSGTEIKLVYDQDGNLTEKVYERDGKVVKREKLEEDGNWKIIPVRDVTAKDLVKSAGEIESDEAVRQSLEYVEDLIAQSAEEGLAYGSLIDVASATEEQFNAFMKAVLELKTEVMILKAGNLVFAFSSGNDLEIHTSPKLAALVDRLRSIDPGLLQFHTHNRYSAQQEGVSPEDIEDVLAGQTKYLGTHRRGFFAYGKDADGQVFVNRVSADFGPFLEMLKAPSDGPQVSEGLARLVAHDIVAAVQEFNDHPELRATWLAGELSEEEKKAFSLGETALTVRTGVAVENMVRRSILKRQDGRYDVTLAIQEKEYVYVSDTAANKAQIVSVTDTVTGVVTGYSFNDGAKTYT
ncbi:MAG: RHS repeat protein, partial [Candidatus Omnitrophica bacterium]|nr:RHS repeat protein [Candidatus Omnitrophota bacterium]